ncbi:MAG: thermonuclease family protein [Halobacterium sp.]
MTPGGRALVVVALVAVAGCTVSIGGLQPDTQPASTTRADGTPADGRPAGRERSATVVHVVDGDTVDVRFADGTEQRVRLLGVDTPEVSGDVAPWEFEGVPDTDAGRACLRRWGERASQYASDRLAGAEVTVTTDPVADERGSYGRLLAYVTTDGDSFNRELLARGYARLYDSPFSRLEEFTATERRARRNDTGLWACAS